MKKILVAGLFLPLFAQAQMNISPGAKVQVDLPMVWNEETKTAEDPAYVTVFEAGSVDTCTFRGGQVTVKKVSGEDVYFDQASKIKNDRCAHMMISKEKFLEWDPVKVKARGTELSKKQDAFKAQLKEDVKAVIEKGGDPCLARDAEMKVDDVYKVSGRVFLYGKDTQATTVDGKVCQMEVGSLVKVLGYNRASDFTVVEYHAADSSRGSVPATVKGGMAETCQEGAQVFFPLARLKSYFDFKEASTEENMRIKGIVSVIRGNQKVCSNETNERREVNSGSTGQKHGDTFSRGSTEPNGQGNSGAEGKEHSAE